MNMEKLREPEFRLNPELRDLTLFTGTFYGEGAEAEVRQQLALDLFAAADKAGVKVFVSDGGSNEGFVSAAKLHPSVTFMREPEGSTMGASRRFALDAALKDAEDDPEHIFMWIEPEKIDLVRQDSLLELVSPIREGKTDVVVPKRESKDTLPAQQKFMEERANRRATNILNGRSPDTPIPEDEVLDLWFGPKVFNLRGAKYFSGYRGKLDKWDSIIAPAIDAHKGGLGVMGVTVEFTYPDSQTAQETGNADFARKRLIQYGKILEVLGDEFWQTHDYVGGKLIKKQ